MRLKNLGRAYPNILAFTVYIILLSHHGIKVNKRDSVFAFLVIVTICKISAVTNCRKTTIPPDFRAVRTLTEFCVLHSCYAVRDVNSHSSRLRKSAADTASVAYNIDVIDKLEFIVQKDRTD